MMSYNTTMASCTYSVCEYGMTGMVVEVECQSNNGLPGVVIVGLATKAVDEAKERLRSAFSSSSLPFPTKRITLNLAPADLQKDGASLDIALAISVLANHQQGSVLNLSDRTVYFGELGLNGKIRPVRGLIGKLITAQEKGFTEAVIPKSQLSQAMLISNMNIFAAESLREVVDWLFEGRKSHSTFSAQPEIPKPTFDTSMEDIIGNHLAKRALEIAAAGGHNVLLNGPPGTGKSMLAKAVPSILPPLSTQQMLEITNIHSLVEQSLDKLNTSPPFRAPHHSASSAAIIGGGQKALPGEISLAHNGVLFLDELPEFHRDCLEALRQPLEDHVVHVSRAKLSVTYPASFMLIATRNPCPCGFYGTSKPCRCSGYDIERYNKKLSGPIIDRIDMHVDVEEIAYNLLNKPEHHEETSEDIRKRIITARNIQTTRNPRGVLNSKLSLKQLTESKNLDSQASKFIEIAAEKLGISARSYVRSLRLARTIADLENSEYICKEHIAESLQYRPKSLI